MEREIADQLSQDIATWLRTNPAREDIFFYVRKLPEDTRLLFPTVARIVIGKLRYDIKNKMSELGIKGFETVPFEDQMYYLESLKIYNARSVFLLNVMLFIPRL